mmetsp:Transcript_25567/g.69219  ORF Transcript_25567/g.69219 Transcript_25567/m.69219 type:complete len:243 (-) Transcript_25567:287-1015(-)
MCDAWSMSAAKEVMEALVTPMPLTSAPPRLVAESTSEEPPKAVGAPPSAAAAASAAANAAAALAASAPVPSRAPSPSSSPLLTAGDASTERMGTPSAMAPLAEGAVPGSTRATDEVAPVAPPAVPGRGSAMPGAPRDEDAPKTALTSGGLFITPDEPHAGTAVMTLLALAPTGLGRPSVGAAHAAPASVTGSTMPPVLASSDAAEVRRTGAPSSPVLATTGPSSSSSSPSSGPPFRVRCRLF